ncbi:DUF4115 domain-containing protein [Altererythrobacter aerius]|uniref:DUF4115 domain-containing protein n=1 Tax=Tsuneonella aeria TaxID=1837929 RepID=A0A6I4TE14_9SPHN|nr:RodZ domain-containing protein [Tsuneonella aeria]MXO75829.1 DUF4115 domain-containing protein [Tsuneonella aeria]
MDDQTSALDGQLPLHGVGDRLRMAREAAGMTLPQLAAETRIPQRHLAMLEAGNFTALPARTYATGFARTYAKAVGLDQRAIVEDVRAELAASEPGDRNRAASFEPGDPARIPSRGLAFLSFAALILLLVGGYAFYNRVLAPGSGPPSLLEEERLAMAGATPPSGAPARQGATVTEPTGPVVFTALDEEVWVRFSDGNGQTVLEKTLLKGETYTVPADARGTTLRTGRPDALAITVGGRTVPKLAESQQVMADVPVTAAALLARGAAQGSASPSAASTAGAPAATAAGNPPGSGT